MQFVDTNILVYAHDSTAGERHEIARSLVNELWASRQGCLSLQVLQEFYVVVTRKVPHPLSPMAARNVIALLSSWQVHQPSIADLLFAIDLQQRYDLSLWDSLILVSAQRLNCTVIWSEDFNTGQRFGDLTVQSPF